MKIAWNKNVKTKRQPVVALAKPGLPFAAEGDNNEDENKGTGEAGTDNPGSMPPDTAQLLQCQGDKLAEEGRYHDALSKWEASLNLVPDNAIIHEQKAQVLLELGDTWRALTAATRATEVKPLWPEAWVTLGRAQLNFGEPDKAIESFDRALAIKPDHNEAKADRETASRLVRKRGQLDSSGDLNTNRRRFTVGGSSEKGEKSEEEEEASP